MRGSLATGRIFTQKYIDVTPTALLLYSRCRASLAHKGERIQGEMPSLCVVLVISLAVSAGCAGVTASGAHAAATADAEAVAAPDHRGLRAHTTTRSIRGGSRSHDAIDVDEELLRLPEWLQLAPFLPTTTSTMLADDGVTPGRYAHVRVDVACRTSCRSVD